MSSPTKAQNFWQNEEGNDFLALVNKQAGVLGGIDSTGTPYGNLASGGGLSTVDTDSTLTGDGSVKSPLSVVSEIGFPQFASYTFSVTGGVVSARNNTTGVVDYSGTDAATVINAVLTAHATVGGTIYFKNGIYPINSLTAETQTGWTNYSYGIGIPSNVLGSEVDWHFEGESRTVWIGETSGPELTNGVIFNVTAAALTGKGSTQYAAAFWQRPDSSMIFTNQIYFKNLCVRFPVQGANYELAFGMYCCLSIAYEKCMADFAQQYSTFTTPGTNAIGFTSTLSASGNTQEFTDCYSVGYQYGYDMESEHINARGINSIYCTYAGIVGSNITGKNTLVYHPCMFVGVVDQECSNGWQLGSEMAPLSRVDFIGYDIEELTTGPWARVSNMTEAKSGNSSGIITCTFVAGYVGTTNNAILFNGGGGINFRVYSSSKGAFPGIQEAVNGGSSTTGTTKQTLYTYTVNNLRINNAIGTFQQSVLHIKAFGTTAINGNSKVVELDWNGTTIASITSTVSGGVIIIEGDVLVGLTVSGVNYQTASFVATDGVQTVPSLVLDTTLNDSTTSGVSLNLAVTTPSQAGDFTFVGWIIEYKGGY